VSELGVDQVVFAVHVFVSGLEVGGQEVLEVEDLRGVQS